MAINVASSLLQTLNLSANNMDVIKVKTEPFLSPSYGVLSALPLMSDLNESTKQKPEDDVAKDGKPVIKTPPHLQCLSEVKPRPKAKKSMKNLAQIEDTLNLDELSSMDGQQLVENFAVMSYNEKYFCYTCHLLPDVCNNFYTSFGNEAFAKNQMQKHLLQHVKKLVADKQKNRSVAFEAEDAAKRPSHGETANRKRGRPCKSISINNNNNKNNNLDINNNNNKNNNLDIVNPSTPSSSEKNLDITDEVGNGLEIIELSNIKKEKDEGDEMESPPKNNSISAHPSQTNKNDSIDYTQIVRSAGKRKSKCDVGWRLQIKPAKRMKIADQSSDNFGTSRVTNVKSSEQHHATTDGHLLNSDHTYDVRHHNPSQTNHGEELNDEIQHFEKRLPSFEPQTIASIGDNELSCLRFSLSPDGEDIQPMKLIIPILTVPRSNLPLNLNDLPNDPFSESDDIYIPKPKLKRRREKGKPENASTASKVAIRLATKEEIDEIESQRGRWTKEQEQILATYYMDEHEKNKGTIRRNENKWKCKICPDRCYTAPTTLTYHYRSHTGAKQFQCDICNDTFTRKHSLDYHKMTHNQTNRFKCDVCGKEFRHTSHFKNHVALHTGDEMSSCKICGSTFKSRTTYNRHMKTKHNMKPPTSNKASRVMSLEMINKIHLGKSSNSSSDAQKTDMEDSSDSMETADDKGLIKKIKMEVEETSEPCRTDSGLGNSDHSSDISSLENVKIERENVQSSLQNVIVIQPLGSQ